MSHKVNYLLSQRQSLRSLFLLLLLPLHACASEYAPAVPMPTIALQADTTIDRIAFGSCFNQTLPSEVFDRVRETEPDVFLFIGDNVYAEDESDDPKLNSLREAYGLLAEVESFKTLRKSVPVLTMWDDHDYGLNDAGGDWPRKQFAESLYEHVWAVPDDDVRSQRDGVYFEKTVGPEGKRVQIILLDLRFFREPLKENNSDSVGPYIPSGDPGQNMLGEDQWQWLAEQLAKPADVRVIVSTVLLLSEIHGWESWRMMPKERDRFYNLVNSTGANGVIVVSGDTHAGGLYRSEDVIDYPLVELNASSLNVPLTNFVKNPQQVPGVYRLGDTYFSANFGLIDINWQTGDITMQLTAANGDAVQQHTVNLAELNRTGAD